MSEMDRFFGELAELKKQMEGVVRFIELKAGVDPVLSVPKNRAAVMLGISRTTLDRMLAEKELAAVIIHGREMISMLELLRLTTPVKRGPRPAPLPVAERSAKEEAELGRARLKARRRR